MTNRSQNHSYYTLAKTTSFLQPEYHQDRNLQKSLMIISNELQQPISSLHKFVKVVRENSRFMMHNSSLQDKTFEALQNLQDINRINKTILKVSQFHSTPLYSSSVRLVELMIDIEKDLRRKYEIGISSMYRDLVLECDPGVLRTLLHLLLSSLVQGHGDETPSALHLKTWKEKGCCKMDILASDYTLPILPEEHLPNFTQQILNLKDQDHSKLLLDLAFAALVASRLNIKINFECVDEIHQRVTLTFPS